MGSWFPWVVLAFIFAIVLAVQVFTVYPKSVMSPRGELYRCSPAMIVFVWAVALGAAKVSFYFPGVRNTESENIVGSVLTAAMTLCAIYVSLYRIIVSPDALLIRGMWPRTVPYRDITDAYIFVSDRGNRFLKIARRSHRPVVISSYYANLVELKKSIQQKIRVASSS
jgi:hypothetical protein